MPAAGRPDLHILARFLDRLAEPGARPLSRSRLQRAVGLNYDLFRKYLAIVVERGWVDDADGRLALSAEGHRVRRELAAWLATLFGGRI
jgi:predicted transcriptional regulator